MWFRCVSILLCIITLKCVSSHFILQKSCSDLTQMWLRFISVSSVLHHIKMHLHQFSSCFSLHLQFFLILSCFFLSSCRSSILKRKVIINWSLNQVLILIFWLNSNTRFQHFDLIWYWSQVDTQFEFLTQLIKKLKMILNVKIYYFWIYYVIIFERLTWNKWIYFSSRCLHYSVALSDTQINISSTSLHVLMSRIENFKSILDLNLLTRLEYLSWIFWLDSNTQVKNSDSNQVLTSQVLDLTRSV